MKVPMTNYEIPSMGIKSSLGKISDAISDSRVGKGIASAKESIAAFGKTNNARALGYKDGRSMKEFALSFISPKAGAEWLDAVKAVVLGMGSSNTLDVFEKEGKAIGEAAGEQAKDSFTQAVDKMTKGAEAHKAAEADKANAAATIQRGVRVSAAKGKLARLREDKAAATIQRGVRVSAAKGKLARLREDKAAAESKPQGSILMNMVDKTSAGAFKTKPTGGAIVVRMALLTTFGALAFINASNQ